MPRVGNKMFPYTPSGIKQAKQAMGRKQKIATQIGQDKVYRPGRDGAKGPSLDQVTAPGTPDKRGSSRRPAGIAGMRFPSFPSRPVRLPGRPSIGRIPGRGPLPTGGMRPGRRPIRPGRGALAPRPWRPKPSNRRYK